MFRCLFAVVLLSGLVAGAEAGYHYTDAHVHLVDFFQESAGVDALEKAMRKGDIDQSVVMGIPVAKKWDENEPREPRYFAGDDANVYWYSATDDIVYAMLQSLAPELRQRLHPFMTGFNPTDKHAAGQIEARLARQPNFWQGIGEVFLRHDDVTALTPGDTPRADNDAMMRVYKVAAKHHLPVLLHSNITSKRERKPIYSTEMEQALKANPKVNFIWAHGGTSETVHRHQGQLTFIRDELARLLEKYDNLYIDLSWSMRDYLLDEKGQPEAAWVALVKRFPTRFMLGSDVVGRFTSLPRIMHAYDPFLDALPAATAKQVAATNLLGLLPPQR